MSEFPCSRCHGKTTIRVKDYYAIGGYSQKLCPNCKGTGQKPRFVGHVVDGQVQYEQTVKLREPKR